LIANRSVKSSLKVQNQHRPIDSIKNCGIFENTHKLSYKVMMDSNVQEKDDVTGQVYQDPLIFGDSFIDDP